MMPYFFVLGTLHSTLFEKPQFFSDLNFRTKTWTLSMKIHFDVNVVWIFAPNMVNNNLWREDSNFIHFKVNFHAQILVFGAKIKIGEK